MCNAFATIDYSANVPDTGSNSDVSDDVGYGIYSHTGSFTFEAVITPYDINGYGCSSVDGHTLVPSGGVLNADSDHTESSSKKIMPAVNGGTASDFQSEQYLSSSARLTHEMRIFHSTNFQFSLVNSTLHNENQPAEYKLKAGIKIGTASMEYNETDVVITANDESQYKYSGTDDLTGFNSNGRFQFNKVAVADSISTNVITLDSGSDTDLLFGGSKLELFVRSGQTFTSIGKITSIASGTTVTMDSTPSVTISSGTVLYVKATKDPLYINDLFHVACSWNQVNSTLSVFLNGRLLKTITHTQDGTFSFANEDFFLGATGGGSTGAGSAVTNKQFMGEMHELCITNVATDSFGGLYNLLPNFDDTLLYLRFEEVDL